MADRDPDNADENTFIKAYEELEKSKTPIRGSEAYPLVEIVQGPKQGAWFTVAHQKEITLGRAATNSIILEDNSVSRSHVVLQETGGGGFTARDIGSRNGTFVNGKKIQGEVPLKHGDVIKVGIYKLRFLAESTEELYHPAEEPTPRVEEPFDFGEATEASMTAFHPETEAAPGKISRAPSAKAERAEEHTPDEDLGGLVAAKPAAVPKVKKTASRSLRNLSILLLVLGVFGGGGFLAYRLGVFEAIKDYFNAPPPVAEKAQPPKVPQPQPQPKTDVVKVDMGPEEEADAVPIFLEVDAQPVRGKIFYRGKEIGITPFKISLQVPAGKPQELSGQFFLEHVKETLNQKESFEIKKQDEMVNILFKPKLGALKIAALPKDGDLYLEGKFAGAESPAKSVKVEGVTFDTPVYLPYGQYVAEIRVPETLEGSESTVKAIRYRREFAMDEKNPEFVINAPDEALKSFPAEINTMPPGAELLVDGKSMGVTPFKGPLPTGRHKITLSKEGFSPFEKEVSIEMNTPYIANFNLQTSPAGEFINRGRDLLRKGLYNESIEQLAEALKRTPDATELSQVHMLLGDAFLQTKTYDQALAYYQRAAENPEYALVGKLGVAEAQAGLGQNAQALINILDVFLNTRDTKIKGRAEATYRRISPMKSVLYVATQPPGAEIMVNGNPIAQPTPVILSDLSVGSYRVKIKKAGFKEYETRVTLPVSAIEPVIIKLEPQP
jgi:pSer/pThr/pTyr-binding forkhead associated (FHA) protein/tetratricopeptide (TPR) repeat protein